MDISQLSINTIRTLSIDAVQKANSGHPGAPLGMAPMAYTLWTRFLKVNPQNPFWMGRDRFVLSAGHASMLIYSLLHLTGYDLPLEEIKNFRQWGSKTPGHPEFHHTKGLDVTTGPLGQGAAMSVGLALGEAHLAARFNRPELEVFANYTYAIVSDGDLQEGISHEAGSLAGHLGLGKLIWLYDDNNVQLDSMTNMSFTDDTTKRFEAYGWQVQTVADGNDVEAITHALEAARAETAKPSLIRVKTIIGYGSPKAGTPKAHGEPLGADGVKATKEALGWDYPDFFVPDEVKADMNLLEKGQAWEAEYDARLEQYKAAHPDLAPTVSEIFEGKLPAGWSDAVPSFEVGGSMATRDASGAVINALAPRLPMLLGGSADLSGSTKTTITGEAVLKTHDFAGRNLMFGVREFGMSAAGVGLALYAGLRPYVGTFFVFSDYLKPSVRLAAMMNQPVIYVLTHDSIGVGEDGPTHQPVEQLASLRSIPNLAVLRPADANETAAAWQIALERGNAPTALVLTRQKLPILPRNFAGAGRGAYVVQDSENAQIILIASGSEVSLALESAKALIAEGIGTRVVSMLSMELFNAQDDAYKNSVLTKGVKRVAIEAASPFGWGAFVGLEGAVIAMQGFGASAPADILFEKFGFSVENVVKVVKGLL